jgi:NitT/TauT family transport system permease protein
MTILSISCAILAWAVFARYFAFPDLVPSPWNTFATGAQLLSSGALLNHVGTSLERVLVGYASGCALGILIGALMGRIQIVGHFFDPLLQLMRPISPVALVPLSIIWFGVGEETKIFLLWLGTFFQLVLLVADDMRRVPHEYVETAYTLGAKPRQVMTDVAFREMLPRLVEAGEPRRIIRVRILSKHMATKLIIQNNQR